MKIFSYTNQKNQPCIGLEYHGVNYNFTQAWEYFKDIKNMGHGINFTFLQMMVELDYFYTETFEEVLQTISELRPLDDLRIGDEINYRVPVERPSKILCLGRNYVAHAKETGHDAPQSPIFFCKASTSLIPHQGTILIPAGIGRVDHEVELAVVIGKTGHAIPENKAWEYVAGYTILNDVTARTLQKNDMAASNPWFRSKSLDTFGPIGPFLVPKSLIPEPHQLTIQLKVNAEIRQQANTAQMIFKIPELIAYISKYMTLNSGDIISTGTPAGISPLADGDIVEAEITGLGLLRNFVLDAPAL